ncbi:MAG: flagellar basal body L-ring protein FlgH [Alphaproteobacteria bacterium]|nr:flagellar basal body L-ring protein FlgH [Alphaproteobacteria bacterium]
MNLNRLTLRLPVILTLAIALSGCNAVSRLSNIGAEPPLTTIQNPVLQANYRPVSMPMPAPKPIERNANSLWRTGARAFFKDQRAADVGDILTVVVDLDDQATINNATTRARTATEDASLNAFLGYESSLSAVLPTAINPGNLLDIDSQTDSTGSGKISRDEQIEVKIAAVVSQVLPNGNMVIHGRQEFRINFEARELQIAGIIRPEDISSTNSIVYEKIAEARISYGGRGQISDLQQPRYGQQVLDILFPF